MVGKKKDVHSAAVFIVSGLGAGLLNYLFQVVAGKNLSAESYANFNGWLANLSILLAAGGFLQYASNFWPARLRNIRLALVVTNLAYLAAVIYWLQEPSDLSAGRAGALIVFTTVFGWLSGQIQVRLAFGALAVAGFTLALFKLGIALLPIGNVDNLDRYSFALFGAYLPALWFSTYFLWSAQEVAKIQSRPTWLAPAVLSLATVAFPQFDIIILSHTQPDAEFAEFVRATLFSRALYFLIFILAQWLLPRQIHGNTRKLEPYIPHLLGAALVISGAITLVSPLLSLHLLGWSEAPAQMTVLTSSLQMALMATLFIFVQDYAAKGRERVALVLVSLICLEGILQFIGGFSMHTYLNLAVGIQSVILAMLWWRGRKVSSPLLKSS